MAKDYPQEWHGWDRVEALVRNAIRPELRRFLDTDEDREDAEAAALAQVFQEWRKNPDVVHEELLRYAVRAARYAAVGILRNQNKGWRQHSDRLRYLVRRYGPHLDLALWNHLPSGQVVGLASWQQSGQPLADPTRIYEIELKTARFVDEALEGQPPHQCDDRWLLLRLLQWLGGPIVWGDLVRVWRVLQGAVRVVNDAGEDHEDQAARVPDRAPTPEMIALSRQLARLVWEEVRSSKLLLHRVATLLQPNGLGHLLFECGIVSLREVCEALNRDADPEFLLEEAEFLGFWNDPFLSDQHLSERFGTSPAQLRHSRQAVNRRLIRLLRRHMDPPGASYR